MYKQIASNKRKTIFLIIIFMFVIWALGYVASLYLDWGYAPLILAFFISIIMSLYSFYNGDKIALSMSRAVPITKEQSPYVFNLVENMAITAGLPTPKVYIINDPALNAFATGRDPEHASVAVTTGLVESLENEELEGVIAHEMSHIKNYDIRVMMVVIICVGIIALLSDWMLRSYFWGGHRRSSNDNGRTAGFVMLIGLVLAILAPLFAKLIQLAVSRKREYLADADGSLRTRYPAGLASALEKISRGQPMQNVNRATAHLFISEPSLGRDDQTGERKKASWLTTLFSTHPPIADRIKRLREMIR